MSTEPPVSFGCEGASPRDLISRDETSVAVTSSQDPTTPKLPVKKQPRQWAAWTRHEEECFFSALRQVGKNFEKITCRVQSKNKDQVRHYYYRLVRRMNKLLGPDLCLDAKNSKVTNAAMLRWWSLLEKYSCKASKLHLKPRRYKLFVETLENQLLRDLRKNTRKQPSQGENNLVSAPSTVSNQGRSFGHDNLAVKEVSADNQKIQKLGSGKVPAVRRHTNVGISRGNGKAESSAMRAAKHRRKKGALSTAAYRRWEKAAIAGVSLVADAAEHLERAASDKEVEHLLNRHFQSGLEHGKENIHPLQNLSQNILSEDIIQGSMKLKLQLFPIDESTRKALEMDNHNPHLELTLSTRKKMSSVLEHLNRKWGKSSIACGELILFPYNVQKEHLIGYQKWTKECNLNAADVYALVGSPSVFRLRYGWFRNAELGSALLQLPSSFNFATISGHNANMHYRKEQNVDSVPTSSHEDSCRLSESIRNQLHPATQITSAIPLEDSPSGMNGHCISMVSDVNSLRYSDNAASLSLPRRDYGMGTVSGLIDSQDDARTQNGTISSDGKWADSLTNISVGDLLSEASHNVDASINSAVACGSHSFQQIPFTSDSFDAAIAAHIYKHRSKAAVHPASACHGSSIWDAEETCDGFAFQKNGLRSGNVQGLSSHVETGKEISRFNFASDDDAIQELDGVVEPLDDHPVQENLVEEYHSHGPTNGLNGLTDIYWPDSLGPLDLDMPSCRYHSEDLILSDSLGGLNRLIASSLDAFHNCSFFGLDKKEPALSVEARETATFADYKIGTEV